MDLVGPTLLGLSLTSTAQITVFAAFCLGLAGFGVAMLRRSRYGRRLIAMRDSEAAFATLGGNLLLDRVAVFALSAGIAGLGGALLGMQVQAVSPEQFNFVAGLPLFLIVVIAGLGAVGAGFFAGAAVAGPLHVIPVLWPGLTNLAHLVPSVAGIAFAGGFLGQGAIARMREEWFPMVRDRAVLMVAGTAFAVLWTARIAEVVDGWGFTLGLVVVVGAARLVAARRAAGKSAAAQPEVPVEWWGVRRPWRPEDKEVLDRAVATTR